jgi:hypothetical protein
MQYLLPVLFFLTPRSKFDLRNERTNWLRIRIFYPTEW